LKRQLSLPVSTMLRETVKKRGGHLRVTKHAGAEDIAKIGCGRGVRDLGSKRRFCDDGKRHDFKRSARDSFRFAGVALEEIALLQRLRRFVILGSGEVITVPRAVVGLQAAIGDPPVERWIALDRGDEPLDLPMPVLLGAVAEAIFDEKMLHRSLPFLPQAARRRTVHTKTKAARRRPKINLASETALSDCGSRLLSRPMISGIAEPSKAEQHQRPGRRLRDCAAH
jgi:hypothetical protein